MAERRRRILRRTAWTVAAVLVALAALALVLRSALDAERLRPRLEEVLTRELGREVTIGRLAYSLSLRPAVSARDLRIAGAPADSGADLLRAGRADLQLDLEALRSGGMAVRSLSVEDADLLLDPAAWGAGAPAVPPKPAGGRLPSLGGVTLRDVRVSWRGDDGSLETATIESAFAVVRDDRPFRLAGRGVVRATPVRFRLAAETPLLAALAGEPWRATLAVHGAGAEAEVEAFLAAPRAAGEIDLRWRLAGEELGALSALAGRELPPWGPYRSAGRLRRSGGEVRLDELALLIEGLPRPPQRIEVTSGEAVLGDLVPTRVALAGTLDGAPFALDAATAPFAELRARPAALPLTARFELARFAAAAQGTIAPGERGAGADLVDLEVTAEGDVFAVADLFAGRSLGRSLAIDLTGRVAVAGRRWRARGLAGTAAGLPVAGELELDLGSDLDPAGKPRLTGELAFERFDVGVVRELTRRRGGPRAAPGRRWYERFEAALDLRAAVLEGLGWPVEEVAVDLALAGGTLRFDDLHGRLAGSEGAGEAALSWPGGRTRLDARLDFPALDVAALRRRPGARPEAVPWPDQPWLDRPLPWRLLGVLDGSLALTAGRVTGTPVELTRAAAALDLERGRLELTALTAEVAGVPVAASATLTAGAEPGLRAAVETGGADLAPLLDALGRGARAGGRLGPARVTVAAEGATLRALAASARIEATARDSTLTLAGGPRTIAFDRLAVAAAPGAPARLEAAVRFEKIALELTAEGGPLAALLDGGEGWERIDATAAATYEAHRIDLTAVAGPRPRLVGGHGLATREVPVRVTARSAGMRGEAEGTIADLRRPLESRLRARVEVDSLARLPPELSAGTISAADLPDLPLRASALVTVRRGAVSAEELDLEAGGSDVRGSLAVAWGERPAIEADLESRLLDLGPWLPRAAPRPRDDSRPRDRGRPLPLDRLRALDAAVRLSVGRLIVPPVDLAEVEVEATLADGVLDLDAGTAEGGLRGALRVEARGDSPRLALRASARDLDVAALQLDGVDTGSPSPRWGGSAVLAASGDTVPDLLASARGRVLVTAGGGEVRQPTQPYLVQAVVRGLLTVLAPRTVSRQEGRLQCAAVLFDVAGGTASSPHGIALRFRRMDVFGGGAIRLDDGEILFGFRAARRRLSLTSMILSGDLAQVSGTVRAPKIGIDPEGLLLKGGAAWATAGLSLVATDLGRRLRAGGDPCGAVAGRAELAPDQPEEPLEALIRAQ